MNSYELFAQKIGSVTNGLYCRPTGPELDFMCLQ